jgi:hypothetical protein
MEGGVLVLQCGWEVEGVEAVVVRKVTKLSLQSS